MADAHTKPYPSVLVLLCWPAPVHGGIRPIDGPFHPSKLYIKILKCKKKKIEGQTFLLVFNRVPFFIVTNIVFKYEGTNFAQKHKK